MDEQGDQIKAVRLYEQVERILAKEIVSGVYDSTDSLPPERALMERFGVGRPAIREALFSLERRGLASRHQGRRMRPLKPNFETVINHLDLVVESSLRDRENVRHLMELRCFVESSLAEKAANSATPKELQKLEALLAAGRAAVQDQEKFWRADIAFHETLAETSHNPILPEIVKAIARWLIGGRRITLSDEDRNLKICDEHEAIFEAIVAKDGRAASQRMITHFEDTERLLGLRK